MVRLPRNEKQTHRMNSRPQMWPWGLTLAMTLTLNLQGQIWILFISQPKMALLPWNEKQTYRLISRSQMWIFKVKCGIGYISAKNGPIATKRKANTSNELYASNVTIRFDLGCDIDLEFPRPNMYLLYLKQKWSDCHETKSKHIDFNSRPQMWPMGLTLTMTLMFEFSRSYVILTIWWPRSGVRIYQIMTGVASDVGVP